MLRPIGVYVCSLFIHSNSCFFAHEISFTGIFWDSL